MTKGTFSLWYRNSIFEDYFSFLRSDLDVTIWFESNDALLQKVNRLRKISRYFIVIKEINFYYPLISSAAIKYINPYELSRDRYLSPKYVTTSLTTTTSSAAQLTYLLRMFFSEADNLNATLSNRSKKKWIYHLSRTQVNKINQEDFHTYEELLTLILKKHCNDKFNVYLQALIELDNNLLRGLPAHIIFESTSYQEEFMCLLPHQFCFAKSRTPIKFSPVQLEIIRYQLEWELWAMMTQPWLFHEHQNTFEHLKNIMDFINEIIELQDLKKEFQNLSNNIQFLLT